MITIFVPDIPELKPIIDVAQSLQTASLHGPRGGYWRIESDQPIEFERRKLGIGPALWNSALTGGFTGSIVEYSRDRMRIEPE